METEQTQGNEGQVEGGEAKLAEVRSGIMKLQRENPINYKNDPLWKVLQKQKHELYASSPRPSNTVRTSIANTRTAPANDLAEQAKAELDKLAELGVDVSSEADLGPDDLTSGKVKGYQHLRLIEEGNFDELEHSLSHSAFQAGFPTEEVKVLHSFFKVAQKDSPLTKDILRLIANHIYQNQT